MKLLHEAVKQTYPAEIAIVAYHKLAYIKLNNGPPGPRKSLRAPMSDLTLAAARAALPSQPAAKSMSPGREFVFAMHDVARLLPALRRDVERRHAVDVFSRDPQDLPAGRK